VTLRRHMRGPPRGKDSRSMRLGDPGVPGQDRRVCGSDGDIWREDLAEPSGHSFVFNALIQIWARREGHQGAEVRMMPRHDSDS
jgi:hypothetical protein